MMMIEPANRNAALAALLPRQPRDISIADAPGFSPQVSNARPSVASPAIGLPSSKTTGVATREVRTLVKDMAATAPVDTAKVSALKAGIANGTYVAQPERIADAMIRSLR